MIDPDATPLELREEFFRWATILQWPEGYFDVLEFWDGAERERLLAAMRQQCLAILDILFPRDSTGAAVSAPAEPELAGLEPGGAGADPHLPCEHREEQWLMVKNPLGPGATTSPWRWCPDCGALASDQHPWKLPRAPAVHAAPPSGDGVPMRPMSELGDVIDEMRSRGIDWKATAEMRMRKIDQLRDALHRETERETRAYADAIALLDLAAKAKPPEHEWTEFERIAIDLARTVVGQEGDV